MRRQYSNPFLDVKKKKSKHLGNSWHNAPWGLLEGLQDQNVHINSVAPIDQARSYEGHCDLGSPLLHVCSNNLNQSSHQSSMRI